MKEILMDLQTLATPVKGTLHGNGALQVRNALPLHDAVERDLTLLDSIKQVPRFMESPALAAIVPIDEAKAIFEQSQKSVIGVTDIHLAFIEAIQILRPKTTSPITAIDPRAIIDSSVVMGQEVSIGAGTIIGADVTIGDRCRIHPGVHIMERCCIGDDAEIFPGTVLYPDTRMGARIILHANTVLGAYGFGYRMQNGKHERTAQLGWVELEDDVEVGAGTTIDRGTYGPTRIGEGTKLDNQIQIGHNCHIGRHNLMCAQVGVAGSVTTGDYVVLGGQVGIRDHITVGSRIMAAAQSGIARDVSDDETVMGTPSLPLRDATQIWIASQRLPDMKKELRELTHQIKALQKATTPSDSELKRAA